MDMVQRNAWEYLIKKIQQINKESETHIILTIGITSLLIGYSGYPLMLEYSSKNIVSFFTLILVWVAGYSVFQLSKLIKKNQREIKSNDKWRIGEQDTAYFLQRTQWKYRNFYVIHDFQLKEWEERNIDHIIICEKWIFAIETKFIKSTYYEEYKEKYKTQTRQEATALKNILFQEFWIKWVIPILCYKNLWVDEKYNYDDICIINNKNIYKVVESSTKQIQENVPEKIFIYLTKLQQEKNYPK